MFLLIGCQGLQDPDPEPQTTLPGGYAKTLKWCWYAATGEADETSNYNFVELSWNDTLRRDTVLLKIPKVPQSMVPGQMGHALKSGLWVTIDTAKGFIKPVTHPDPKYSAAVYNYRTEAAALAEVGAWTRCEETDL